MKPNTKVKHKVGIPFPKEKRKIDCVSEWDIQNTIQDMIKKGWTHVSTGRHYEKFTIKFERLRR